jgi:hypothetical protein
MNHLTEQHRNQIRATNSQQLKYALALSGLEGSYEQQLTAIQQWRIRYKRLCLFSELELY